MFSCITLSFTPGSSGSTSYPSPDEKGHHSMAKKTIYTSKKKAPKKLTSGQIALICILTALFIIACVFIAVKAQPPVEAENTDLDTTAAETEAEPEAEPTADAETEPEAEPELTSISLDKTYYADITVKDYGTITVELDATQAPITVDNFVTLANDGFYDGLTFHRIMDGFMMQGGDPTGTGSGDSGKNIEGEFAANGHENNITHTRGAISMARANDYNSGSCQFFIVQSDSTFLDGNYAGFGYVTEGMDYVDAICTDAKPTDDNGTIPADEQPIIESIVIREE